MGRIRSRSVPLCRSVCRAGFVWLSRTDDARWQDPIWKLWFLPLGATAANITLSQTVSVERHLLLVRIERDRDVSVVLFHVPVPLFGHSILRQVCSYLIIFGLVFSTSDHTPASNNTPNQPSLFRLLPLFHSGLWALLCCHSAISHPHFLKPWMSEIPRAFKCLHSGGGLLIYCWSLNMSLCLLHIPPLLFSLLLHLQWSKHTLLLFLFIFHFCYTF